MWFNSFGKMLRIKSHFKTLVDGALTSVGLTDLFDSYLQ